MTLTLTRISLPEPKATLSTQPLLQRYPMFLTTSWALTSNKGSSQSPPLITGLVPNFGFQKMADGCTGISLLKRHSLCPPERCSNTRGLRKWLRQSVKYLPRRHENPSSAPRHPGGESWVWLCVPYLPCAVGERDRRVPEACWPNSLALGRDPVSANRVEKDRGRYLTSGLHMLLRTHEHQGRRLAF